MKTMLLAALLLGGCSSSGLRGDGTLAIINVSSNLHSMQWNSTINGKVDAGDMVDAFCVGAHLWDVAGARVRCPSEDTSEPASSIEVVPDASDYAPAWWSPSDGRIHVHAIECEDISTCGAFAAHEIGHALGLQHIESGNLMSPSTDALTLTPADKTEFRSLWN